MSAQTPAYQSDARYTSAMEAYLAGDWADAAERFSTLDEAFPNESFVKLLRGNIDYALGKLDDAVAHYRAAVQLRPDFGNAHYKMGVCLYRMGQLPAALSAFTDAAARGSQSHKMARYFIGLINMFMGHDAEATEAFSRFSAESPESLIANVYVAQLKIKHKQYNDAIPLLEKLAVGTPDFGDVHYLLGVAYHGLHKPQEAVRAFQRAVEIDPNDERSKGKLTLLTDVQWP